MDRGPATLSDSRSTTVTQASAAPRGAEAGALALAWLFPRPVDPRPDRAGGREAGAGELIIGRDAACDLRLDGSEVSRRHAVLRREGPDGALAIVDLGSRNGLRVNDRTVVSASLARGDVVRIGGWIGVVTASPGAFKEIAPGLLGGAALQAALAPLLSAASSDLPIVLEGETGTGKEIVTRAVHRWSQRVGPLVAVNCGALPEGLAEAELFGYRRGAFTGAERSSPGLFRGAEGGTLLLDEVTDLPLALQAKLLRVLEQREVQPLGETRPVPIDVRVIAAGQQSLAAAVRKGLFRPDLLARLDGVTVHLPPLRQRREDVPPLFSRLLRELSQRPDAAPPELEAELIERLCLHDWPFNVRELVLLVRRLLVLHGDERMLRVAHLPERIGAPGAAGPGPVAAGPGHEEFPIDAPVDAPIAAPVDAPFAAPPARAAEPVEMPALVSALRVSAGNVARAAAMLGISRQRAYRLMQGASLDLEALRHGEGPSR